MMAVDSSVLLAILNEEPEAPHFAKLLANHDWIIGAPTAFESQMVVKGKDNPLLDRILETILNHPTAQIIPFTQTHYAAATLAFERFGKGRPNRAKLNFGDCMSYAIAYVEGVPLLFKGDDFPSTDIEPAYRP